MYGLVRQVSWPAPSLARIELEGPGLDDYAPSDATDAYINAAFAPEGAAYAPAPFDLGELKGLPVEERPFRRRYSVRAWDPEQRVLTLEIIVHGETGAGGAWALHAQPGDALVFTGPAGSYRPDPQAGGHLLVGDESALPAIAASLEAVPEGAPVVVRLVCDAAEDEVPLTTPGELDLQWLHRTGDTERDEALLADAVRAATLPAGPIHAFVHGEAGETRAVRRVLLGLEAIDHDRLSCSPYWRRGMADEEWRTVKAAWNADVARDTAA